MRGTSETIFLQMGPTGHFEPEDVDLGGNVLRRRTVESRIEWHIRSTPGLDEFVPGEDGLPAEANHAGVSLMGTGARDGQRVLVHLEPVKGAATVWIQQTPGAKWTQDLAPKKELGRFRRVVVGDFDLASPGKELLIIR